MPTITPKDDKYTLALAREVSTLNVSLAGKATTGGMAAADAAVLASAIQRANHTGTQSADSLTDGTTNKAFLATERTKLTGIATSATANSTDAVLLARANHTGTQSADTLTDGSTNKAFLATERTKLSGIATSATANSADATLLARANHTGTQLAATVSDFNAAALSAAPAETATTFGALTHGATAKTTPVDADEIGLIDSAASNIWKRVTWANVKATLKTYFDTLYQPVATVLTNTTASFTTALETKLSGIASGATANSSDATLLARANHTGTQLAATISDFNAAALLAAPAETASTLGATVNGASAAVPNDTDIVATAASSVVKKITWTNVKAFLKTYFDTLYPSGSGTSSGANTGDNAANTQYSGLSASKQDTLVSGTTIKTINGSTVLGSGDLVVAASASDTNRNLYISTADVNLTANYGIYYPSEYEVGSGFVTDLASAAIMEIG